MKAFKSLVLTVSTAILAACATTTPYQPASTPGGYDGYSQTMLQNDMARISFGGNSLTSRDTVENYLLYRAAEIAIERGFDHFMLVERDTEEKTRVRVSPRYGAYDPYFDYAFYRPGFGWGPYYRYSYFNQPYYRRGWGFMGYGNDPFYNDFDVRESTKYRASAEVRFGKGPKPERDNAFDAQQVLDNLGPTIVYPEEDA